jgi:hypothetical protein
MPVIATAPAGRRDDGTAVLLATSHWLCRLMKDGFCPLPLSARCDLRQLAADTARFDGGNRRVRIGGGASGHDASPDQWGLAADRAHAGAIPGRAVAAGQRTGGPRWCNSRKSELHPTATVRMAGADRRASGGGLWLADRSGAARARDGGAARGLAPGGAHPAAALPGVGGGIAGLRPCAAQTQSGQTAQAPRQAGAFPHPAPQRRADGRKAGGLRKALLSAAERGDLNVPDNYRNTAPVLSKSAVPRHCEERSDAATQGSQAELYALLGRHHPAGVAMTGNSG